jgi:hypothetical protein
MNSASVHSPHRLFKNSSSGYIGWRNSFLGINSWAPQTFKNTGSGTQEEGGGGEEGGKGGAEGRKRGRGGDDLSPGISGADVHQMFQKIQNNTLSSLFRGGGRRAGCVYSSKSIERSSSIFGKILGEIEFEFL